MNISHPSVVLILGTLTNSCFLSVSFIGILKGHMSIKFYLPLMERNSLCFQFIKLKSKQIISLFPL